MVDGHSYWEVIEENSRPQITKGFGKRHLLIQKEAIQVSHRDEQGVLTDSRRDSRDPLSVHRIRAGRAGLHYPGVFQEVALGEAPRVSGVPRCGDRCCGGPGVGEPAVSADDLGERTPGAGRGTTLWRDIHSALGWQIGLL